MKARKLQKYCIYGSKRNRRKFLKKIKKKAKVLKNPHRYIECKQGMQQFIQNVASFIILPYFHFFSRVIPSVSL